MFFPNNICVTDRLRWHHVGVGYWEKTSHWETRLEFHLPIALIFHMPWLGWYGRDPWLALSEHREPTKIGCLYNWGLYYTPLKKTPQLVYEESRPFSFGTLLRVSCLSWPLFILFFSSRIFFRLRPRSPTSLLDSNTQPVGKGHLWKSMPHIYLLGFDTPPFG